MSSFVGPIGDLNGGFLTDGLVQIGIIVALALVGTWLVGRLVRVFRDRLVERAGAEADAGGEVERTATRAETVSSVLRAAGVAVIWSLAGLVVLGEVGVDLAPLVAGLGIVGLALGFGAQNLVADFLSGLFMLVEDQYGEGDFVDLGEAAGIVEKVGLRTTRVRDVDGMLWTVRNGQIVRTGNGNHRWARAVLDIGVAYDADIRQAAAVIKRAADETQADPQLADSFLAAPEVWGVQELGADAVTVRLVAKTRPGSQWAVARALRLRVKEDLDEAGVELPFSQRTVWIRTEPETLAEPIPFVMGRGDRSP